MDYLHKLDNLTQGVECILAKNRSSLSVVDVAQLEEMLITLKELKEVKSSSDRKVKMSYFLTLFLKVYTHSKILKEIAEKLEELLNF